MRGYCFVRPFVMHIPMNSVAAAVFFLLSNKSTVKNWVPDFSECACACVCVFGEFFFFSFRSSMNFFMYFFLIIFILFGFQHLQITFFFKNIVKVLIQGYSRYHAIFPFLNKQPLFGLYRALLSLSPSISLLSVYSRWLYSNWCQYVPSYLCRSLYLSFSLLLFVKR